MSEGLGVPSIGVASMLPRAGPDDELLDELMDLTGQSGALLLPVVGILAPLTKLSRRMLARWKQSPPSTASDMLWESITELARDRPRVLVFGDVTDAAQTALWQTIRYVLTTHLPHPLLVVCEASGHELLSGRQPNVGEVGAEFPASSALADVIAARDQGIAVFRWIGILDRVQVERWLGACSIDVADRLIAVSGGSTTDAAKVWQAWRAAHRVARIDGAWRFTSSEEPMEDDIRRILAPLSGERRYAGADAPEVARRALHLAALSGPTFSGTAVSTVVAEEYGCETDEVLDLLDDLVDQSVPAPPELGGRPLVSKAGAIHTIRDPVEANGDYHWTYGWRSETLRRFLAATDGPASVVSAENRRSASRLVEAGRDAYGWHPEFFDATIPLLRLAGRPDEAEVLVERLANRTRRRMLEPQATAMLAGPTDDPLAAEPLTSLCFELITCGFPKLAIAVGERSVSCAEAGSNLMAQGFASLRFGEALHRRGDERAVPRLKLAVNKLRRVLESDPDNPTYLRALGIGLGALGNDYQGQGNLADAVGAHTESVTHRRRVLESDPDNPTYLRDLGIGLGSLGDAYRGQGNLADAVGAHTESVTHRRRVLESDPDNPTYLRALGIGLGSLGDDYQGQGNLADAVGAHTESVTHYRRVLESDPDNQRWISELDRALQKLTDLRGTNEN
ncbi:tetratricopeptide repeat protein [Candidatus Microthrix parvicella]|uniref:tetratricopeptide repeat protein n=1 Tax=Candidatus Neomicrothrix parvicella TaxID=41950 RepID=UPI0012DD5FA0|nr:tetratricopeptide repeat protein [Candidatus Microthrix parvicella]